MKLNILILAHNFPPEFGGGATMQFELASHLAHSGHHVTVIAPLPPHHIVDAAKKSVQTDEIMDGFHIVRITTPALSRTSVIRRAINEAVTDFLLAWRGLRVKPVDVLFIMPQTVTLALFSAVIKRMRKSVLLLYLQDIYPELLISMNVLTRNHLIFRLAKVFEKLAYHCVDTIGVHSPKNRNYVISCGIDEKKVQVIPLWVDTGFITDQSRHNHFSKANQLDRKFVVTYAGTVGFAMGAKTIPQAARILAGEEDIQFIVVGGGSKLGEMQEEIKRLALKNFLLFSPRPREELPEMLAACDVLLVLLRKELSENPNGYFKAVIPHKLLSNMASGRPILLSAEEQSDAARLVRLSRCGLVVPPEDPEAMADAILKMKKDHDQLATWGINGIQFARKHFDSIQQVKRIEDLFISLVTKSSYQFNDPWSENVELSTK